VAVDSETIVSGTILMTGIPLLDAADIASLAKCSKT